LEIRDKLLFHLIGIAYLISFGEISVKASNNIYDMKSGIFTKYLPVEYIFVPIFLSLLLCSLTVENKFVKEKL
jgi:hypothetical protein